MFFGSFLSVPKGVGAENIFSAPDTTLAHLSSFKFQRRTLMIDPNTLKTVPFFEELSDEKIERLASEAPFVPLCVLCG